MKNYTFWCGIFNLICLIIIFVISIIMIINVFKMIVVRILLIIISFFLSGFIEERFISQYINSFVEYIQKKKISK